jgi:hypothetical protein
LFAFSFFAIGIVNLVWGDRRGEDKTLLGIGLMLRDFCYLIAIVVSCCVSYSYRSPWSLYWLSCYCIVVSCYCIGRVCMVVPCDCIACLAMVL